MARRMSNQWEFGETDGSFQESSVLTVERLTRRIRSLLEGGFTNVQVSGEVSNLRIQASGHAYFSLKGVDAQLQCVLFRSRSEASRKRLSDGAQVVATGSISVYEPRGQYQLIVSRVAEAGIGELSQRFEALKAKLNAEGLFDSERKRPISRRVYRLGIVTSETGAALRDVAHVVARRYPGLRMVLAPCRVQGNEAIGEIVGSIERLNEWSRTRESLDAILVTRGGGSLEDLWAFNEERVVRAIAGSEVPVVSGVGHEIDTTLSDLAADLRAATPSAAAETLTEGMVEVRAYLRSIRDALPVWTRNALGSRRDKALSIAKRLELSHPGRATQMAGQRLDELDLRLRRATRRRMNAERERVAVATRNWRRGLRTNPVRERRERLEALMSRASWAVRSRHERDAARARQALAILRTLAPQRALDRGFSLTLVGETRAVARDASQLPAGSKLVTYLKNGAVESEVLGPSNALELDLGES